MPVDPPPRPSPPGAMRPANPGPAVVNPLSTNPLPANPPKLPADDTHPVLREIELLIKARYPALYLVSSEESRVHAWFENVAAKRNKKLWEWSQTVGLVQVGPNVKPRNPGTRDPQLAFDEVAAHTEPAIYVFKDLHPFLTNDHRAVVRRLKELAHVIKDTYKTIVLVSPVLTLPPELEKELTVIDFPLPGPNDVGALLDRIINEIKSQPGISIQLDSDNRERLLQAALGLTLGEAENVFARTIVATGRLGHEAIAMVAAEKKQIIRKNGLLDYFEADLAMSDVGGLDLMKEWLAQRGLAFSNKARAFGLPSPKGVLLLGVQGCGKSLSAKAVAGMWRMPLLRLDMGKLFGGLIGASEENMRRALQIADSVAPVVLWLDEIDKALAGTRSSGTSDGGVTARLFGTFLTWLAEKTNQVFVVATANDISALPPELLRKGRFDELFFIDLPSLSERRAILRLHLQRRKRDPERFDLDRLALQSDGFSGAELEQAVVDGLFSAFAANKELASKHLSDAIATTVPLSRTMTDSIAALREWAKGRTRPASSPDQTPRL